MSPLLSPQSDRALTLVQPLRRSLNYCQGNRQTQLFISCDCLIVLTQQSLQVIAQYCSHFEFTTDSEDHNSQADEISFYHEQCFPCP